MRVLLASLFVLGACAGPGHNALAETPIATTKARPAEAPPASDSDKERARAIQQMDEMQAAEQAHREADHGEAPAPPPRSTTTKSKPAPTKQPAPTK